MKLWKLFRAEPVATMAVVSAVVTVLVIVGVPKGITGALAGLLAAVLAFPVRSGVSPVSHVVEATTKAATDAAIATAEALDVTTVGLVGTATDAAVDIVQGAVNVATSGALRTIGVKRKDLA